MTHLYLIRHGDYIYEYDETMGKKVNKGLSAEGIKQSESLRERLARTGELKPDVLIASTERGAHETAEILAPALAQPIILDEEVEEWRSEDGTLSSEEFSRRWKETPESQKLFYRFLDNCESWLEFSVRVQQALNRILQAHEGKNIVIVTHGGVVQVAFAYFFGYGIASVQRAGVSVKNTSITHWFKADKDAKWTLERFNDYHHLNG
jgi:2,3-bisphosphoglycerate-dependent phosphoglycerate mutase